MAKHDADAIVIGTGIGGIAIGALLAHQGRKVIVLERNEFLGGRCTSYEKEGFVIDVFAHLTPRCEKGPFGDIMRRVERPDAIQYWHATPDNKPILSMDGEPHPCLTYSFSTREELAQTYRAFGLSDQEVQGALKIKDTVLEMEYAETTELDSVPYSKWLKQFKPHPTVLALENQWALMYSVATLKEISTGEYIRMSQNCERDANMGYPMGGIIRIPEAMAEVVRDHAGEVRVSTPVEKILVEANKVRGVKLADGTEVTAPLVISNAGIKETATRLVGKDFLPSDYLEHVEGLTTGKLVEQTPMGLIYMKLALDEPVIDVPLIFFNVKENHFEGAKELMMGLLTDQPPKSYGGISTFIPITSNMDPNLAPPGKQLVNFYGLAPFNSKDWQPWIDYHMRFMFNLYPDLEKHLMWYDFSTSNRIGQFSGRIHPDVVGIVQSVGQTGKDRPSPVTPIDGLYLVGADVGRDNIGTELAAESAIRLAEMILRAS